MAYASKKHHAFLAELGATQCVDRAAVSLDTLASVIPSAHVVYDCVAADEGFAASKIVRPDGCAITVDIVSDRSDAAKEVGKGKKFVAVWAVSFLPGGHGEVGEKIWSLFGKLLEQGVIKVRCALGRRLRELTLGLAEQTRDSTWWFEGSCWRLGQAGQG